MTWYELDIPLPGPRNARGLGGCPHQPWGMTPHVLLYSMSQCQHPLVSASLPAGKRHILAPCHSFPLQVPPAPRCTVPSLHPSPVLHSAGKTLSPLPEPAPSCLRSLDEVSCGDCKQPQEVTSTCP